LISEEKKKKNFNFFWGKLVFIFHDIRKETEKSVKAIEEMDSQGDEWNKTI